MRELTRRIDREGPLRFSTYLEVALYGAGGFFAEGRGAGRAGGDFLTSPEVGPLFGALVAGFLDRSWRELGALDPFVVAEVGAGRGRLAADVLRAAPSCAPSLRYVMVERSERLRARQAELVRVEPVEDVLGPAVAGDDDVPRPVPGLGPLAASLAELPEGPWDGVILANELLDNLPFDVVERDCGGWSEVRVGVAGDALVEVRVPAAERLVADAETVAAGVVVPEGARLPVPAALDDWLEAAARVQRRGHLVVVDYVADAAELVARAPSGWLRTHREHRPGGHPLEDPGGQDVTADVPAEALVARATVAGYELVERVSQAEWLRSLGVDEIVERARARWDEGAARGDLEALAARSTPVEAAALTDPAGLGAHEVLTFRRSEAPARRTAKEASRWASRPGNAVRSSPGVAWRSDREQRSTATSPRRSSERPDVA